MYTWYKVGKYPDIPGGLSISLLKNRMYVDHCIKSLRASLRRTCFAISASHSLSSTTHPPTFSRLCDEIEYDIRSLMDIAKIRGSLADLYMMLEGQAATGPPTSSGVDCSDTNV
jgi:hypothetical protein